MFVTIINRTFEIIEYLIKISNEDVLCKTVNVEVFKFVPIVYSAVTQVHF